MSYKHLFGPVNSRRLGISLGVDLTPHKTCTLDCVYCECGDTTDLTVERRPYVPAAEIIAELDACLAAGPQLDYVTFGGSGEPTLNSEFPAVLDHLKRKHPGYHTALLTNGTLLHLPDVRRACLGFDLVKPSLDAVSHEAFHRVNRCHPSLDNRRIVQGIAEFAREYTGLLWLEVFIVPGANDSPSELALFREAIARINPTRVQLNSLDRPGPCDWVEPATAERLAEIARFLLPLPVEIVTRSAASFATGSLDQSAEEPILATCRRRPCTVEEIASLTHRHINETYAILGSLKERGLLEAQRVGKRVFYRGASRNT